MWQILLWIVHITALCHAFISQPRCRRVGTTSQCKLHLHVATGKLLSSQDYDTIQQGRIAVIPNFIPAQDILSLRSDAQALWNDRKYTTDALASYGASGAFDPSRDRAVLKLSQWQDQTLGTYQTRQRLGSRMAALRADLAYHLDRPQLNQGLATTQYGQGSTEISYTRFGPGAFLKRHVDEHHEELKDTAGWAQPTRRSVSWLIYLNDKDWNASRDGGQLRCFERTILPSRSVSVGARPNGDLQLAWLRALPYSADPVERPVFLDARRPDNKCAMYIVQDDSTSVQYITPDFESHPILYMAGGETMVKQLLLERHFADRFHFIEAPKSKLGDLLQARGRSAERESPAAEDELLADVTPIGGTLVLFDSVSLPHEVLATQDRERWATSGWFHEDQQPTRGRRGHPVEF